MSEPISMPFVMQVVGVLLGLTAITFGLAFITAGVALIVQAVRGVL